MADFIDSRSWNTKEGMHPSDTLFDDMAFPLDPLPLPTSSVEETHALLSPASYAENLEENAAVPTSPYVHTLPKKRKSDKKKLKRAKKHQKKLLRERQRAERRLRKAQARAEALEGRGDEAFPALEAHAYPLKGETDGTHPVYDEESEPLRSVEKLSSPPPSFPHPEGASAYFDGILEKLKQRKSRNPQLSTMECIDFIHRVLQQMREAREADDRATEENRPAVAKLQLLDYIVDLLSKPKWKELFVSEGCCQAIASWLTPLKDDRLPNITIRQKLLQLVEKLPIQAQELQNNDLGVVLVMLWKHEDETEENRTLIRQLIQRWMRPLLGLASSFKDYRLSQQMEISKSPSKIEEKTPLPEFFEPPKSSGISTIPKIEKDVPVQPEKFYRHARRPEPDKCTFMVQPKSDINLSQSASRKRVKGPLNKMLDSTRIPKIPHHAQNLSLEGRDLLN